MDLIRIGDKIISHDKLWRQIEKIMDFRVKGISQQETARRMGLDRAFISRLESLGEVRKGHRIAVLAFPIKNKLGLQKMLAQEGIDFSLIMTETERWDFVREGSGLELFNKVMELTGKLKEFDSLMVIASDKRIEFFQSLFNGAMIGIEIGRSPIQEDKYVDVEQVRSMIKTLRAKQDQEGN